MTRPVDPEVLSGFLEEARAYLPGIRHGIDAFRADPAQAEALAEAHRQAHNIKAERQCCEIRLRAESTRSDLGISYVSRRSGSALAPCLACQG